MDVNQSDIWLFGYGSLIWRPGFPYKLRFVGEVEGWVRRFWQGSHDHRGVPEAPGRVVTLVREERAICGGMVYCIEQQHATQIFNQLDYREKNGYERFEFDCTLLNGEKVRCITYVAGPSNEAYLGEASLEEIAAQIKLSHGPSGSNRDYLLELAGALREFEISDEHVFELERLVWEV